jgi:hypothetical protein
MVDGVCGAQLTQLEVLSVKDNLLGAIPSQIEHLTNLKALLLDRNKLAHLPSTISSLSSLRELSLFGNASLAKLPNSFKPLHALKRIDLQCTRVSKLPKSLESLQLQLGDSLQVIQDEHVSDHDTDEHSHQALPPPTKDDYRSWFTARLQAHTAATAPAATDTAKPQEPSAKRRRRK